MYISTYLLNISMHLSCQEIFMIHIHIYYEKLTEFISIRIRMLLQILEFQTGDKNLVKVPGLSAQKILQKTTHGEIFADLFLFILLISISRPLSEPKIRANALKMYVTTDYLIHHLTLPCNCIEVIKIGNFSSVSLTAELKAKTSNLQT